MCGENSIGRATVERILKSFGFSLAMFLVWEAMTAPRAWSVVRNFEWLESCWVLYNATIAVLFLIRYRPTVVSLNPLHWAVALVTSFSGFFFRRSLGAPGLSQAMVADGLIVIGLALGTAAAIALGRRYDFLPALRGVQSRWLYALVRPGLRRGHAA